MVYDVLDVMNVLYYFFKFQHNFRLTSGFYEFCYFKY